MQRTLLCAIAVAIAGSAHAAPTGVAAAVRIAAIVPGPGPADDARAAVVIGASGEVYAPDGHGAWVHRLASATAGPVVAAARAGTDIVVLGDGVVYRLAATGWSAVRLVQHGKAVMTSGRRAVAAVGRQLFALDRLTRGEPARLAVAPADVVAIGAGATAIVVATDTALWRLEPRGKPVALPPAAEPLRLISDRWAIGDPATGTRGALDLIARSLTAWPDELAIGVAATAPDEALVTIGTSPTGLELVTLRGRKLTRDPLGVTGSAVGIVVDRAGRAVVALADGRIAVRDQAGWTITEVTEALPAAHPGPGPARSD